MNSFRQQNAVIGLFSVKMTTWGIHVMKMLQRKGIVEEVVSLSSG